MNPRERELARREAELAKREAELAVLQKSRKVRGSSARPRRMQP
jgi:hypothetical protein